MSIITKVELIYLVYFHTNLNLLRTCFSLKDTSRQLTAAFNPIYYADPSSSPSMITQLLNIKNLLFYNNV